jgi:hypothetical protein
MERIRELMRARNLGTSRTIRRTLMKIVKAAAAAAMLLSGATCVMAQAQNPNADKAPMPPDGTSSQPYDTKAEPTNPPPGPAVGSRPMGPSASSDAPETLSDKNTTDIKRLDKQGRGGQQN